MTYFHMHMEEHTMSRINVTKLMAHNPTLIGSVAGINFYEHPTRGDEAGLIAVRGCQAVHTDWYDLPRTDDVLGDDGSTDEFMELYAD